MAETFVQVTEGSGKKLHSFDRTIGANSVHDEIVVQGEPYLATYRVVAGASTATLDSHLLQIMAGGTLRVYVRRIRIYQENTATTAARCDFGIYRLTTAGTGGGAQTESPLDTTDAASGAQGMTLPSAKGTEGALLDIQLGYLLQTVPASPGITSSLLADFNWESPRQKSLIIAAGTSNGIAVKNRLAVAGATVTIIAEYIEANF